MNPDRLGELEEERRFLLDSIRDLEREHDAGDVDDGDYVTLRDGYVARAAAVLREIEDGKSRMAARPRRPLWQKILIPVVTIGVGVALGVMVANFAGQRLPGQAITGGQTPDEVASLLAQARQALGSDMGQSLSLYQKVLELEPQNPEALTYSAWLVVLTGQQSGDQATVAQGIEALQAAADVDPTYADPVCFLAVARGRMLQPPDVDGAKEAGQACLAADPPADMVPMIEGMLSTLG